MRPGALLALALLAGLAAAGPAAQALATEVSWSGERLGILVLTPEDMSTVYMKPGEKLEFKVAIPDYVKVKRVTLYLCGSTYEMKPIERWGSMVIYGVAVELPPRNDLYSWRVVVETDRGTVSSCTHKTLVIFNTTDGADAEEKLAVVDMGEGSDICPLLPPPRDSAEASGETEAPAALAASESGISTTAAAAAAAASALVAAAAILRKTAPHRGGVET